MDSGSESQGDTTNFAQRNELIALAYCDMPQLETFSRHQVCLSYDQIVVVIEETLQSTFSTPSDLIEALAQRLGDVTAQRLRSCWVDPCAAHLRTTVLPLHSRTPESPPAPCRQTGQPCEALDLRVRMHMLTHAAARSFLLHPIPTWTTSVDVSSLPSLLAMVADLDKAMREARFAMPTSSPAPPDSQTHPVRPFLSGILAGAAPAWLVLPQQQERVSRLLAKLEILLAGPVTDDDVLAGLSEAVAKIAPAIVKAAGSSLIANAGVEYDKRLRASLPSMPMGEVADLAAALAAVAHDLADAFYDFLMEQFSGLLNTLEWRDGHGSPDVLMPRILALPLRALLLAPLHTLVLSTFGTTTLWFIGPMKLQRIRLLLEPLGMGRVSVCVGGGNTVNRFVQVPVKPHHAATAVTDAEALLNRLTDQILGPPEHMKLQHLAARAARPTAPLASLPDPVVERLQMWQVRVLGLHWRNDQLSLFLWRWMDGHVLDDIGISTSECGRPLPLRNGLAVAIPTVRKEVLVFSVHTQRSSLRLHHQYLTSGCPGNKYALIAPVSGAPDQFLGIGFKHVDTVHPSTLLCYDISQGTTATVTLSRDLRVFSHVILSSLPDRRALIAGHRRQDRQIVCFVVSVDSGDVLAVIDVPGPGLIGVYACHDEKDTLVFAVGVSTTDQPLLRVMQRQLDAPSPTWRQCASGLVPAMLQYITQVRAGAAEILVACRHCVVLFNLATGHYRQVLADGSKQRGQPSVLYPLPDGTVLADCGSSYCLTGFSLGRGVVTHRVTAVGHWQTILAPGASQGHWSEFAC